MGGLRGLKGVGVWGGGDGGGRRKGVIEERIQSDVRDFMILYF